MVVNIWLLVYLIKPLIKQSEFACRNKEVTSVQMSYFKNIYDFWPNKQKMNGGLLNRAMIFKICRNVEKLKVESACSFVSLNCWKTFEYFKEKNKYTSSSSTLLHCSCNALSYNAPH